MVMVKQADTLEYGNLGHRPFRPQATAATVFY